MSIADSGHNEVVHNGTRIYKILIALRGGDAPSERWAVQSHDNKRLAAEGKRTIGGDSLHTSLEAARSAADSEAKRDVEVNKWRDEMAAQEAEALRKVMDRKAATKGKSLAQIRADDYLAKLVWSNDAGASMTRASWVQRMLDKGAEPSMQMVDKIKPMSRMAAFRASTREGDYHARKIKDAGKVRAYWLGDVSVSKTEYDYAHELLAINEPPINEPPAAATDLPTTEQFQTSEVAVPPWVRRLRRPRGPGM